MENEILLQILSELKSLNVRQSGVEQKLDGVEQRLDGMDQRLDGVERRQVGLAEELMAFQEFTMQKFERLEKRFDGLEGRFDGLENGQKKLNLIMENEIRPSIQVLAEGQVMMQGQLDRIEKRVTAHDEIVFRRVK